MNDTGQRAEAVDSKSIYGEAGSTYRYFLEWRNKIVAGYLGSIGALGLGYTRAGSEEARDIVLISVVIVSLVFWIFDFRNRKLCDACLDAAKRLEQKSEFFGPYAALESARFNPPRRLTHGLAINLLVAWIIVTSASALSLSLWCSTLPRRRLVLTCAVVIFLVSVLVVIAECLGERVRDSSNAAESNQTGESH